MRQLKISNSITARESLSLEKYLQEIGKVDLLTPEGEVDLVKKIRAGDKEAIIKLTKANLRFVVSVAKQYQNQGLSLSDLINEGNLGLIKAAGIFDETKGFKFISYAVWWIRQRILFALSEHGRVVRLPLNNVNYSYKISRATGVLEQELEREPSLEEISEYLDERYELVLTTENIQNILAKIGRHMSIDAPIEQDNSFVYLTEIMEGKEEDPDKKMVYKESLGKDLSRVLGELSPKERDVIQNYYGMNERGEKMQLEQIGEMFGYSPETTRQIKERALKKLRNSKTKKLLLSYL